LFFFSSFSTRKAHARTPSKPNNIRLNFEDVAALDKLLVDGLHMFVNGAPNDWKEDGFLLDRSPIVVTTCFGQNARVCVPNNENREAMEWHNERDYSKIAFLTVAIATSIQCVVLFKKMCSSSSSFAQVHPYLRVENDRR
jgi:hypothetical protein